MSEEVVIYGADGMQVQACERWPSSRRMVMLAIGAFLCIAWVLLAIRFELTKPTITAISTVTGSDFIVSDSPPLTISGLDYMHEHEVKAKGIWNHRPILNAPLDAPPRKIRVGPYVYRVRYTSARALDSQNAYALTDTTNAHEIWLNPKRDLRTDLMHELMHCAKDVGTGASYLSTGGSEEDIIHVTAPMMVSILRDNPQLTAWLISRETK